MLRESSLTLRDADLFRTSKLSRPAQIRASFKQSRHAKTSCITLQEDFASTVGAIDYKRPVDEAECAACVKHRQASSATRLTFCVQAQNQNRGLGTFGIHERIIVSSSGRQHVN